VGGKRRRGAPDANERGVGRGIARAGVPRAEVFVTTKLRGRQHGYEAALAGFEESRARLGLDYVDPS
jgi:2,5-diketo-D-gluconate reductase A